jgi:selenocysteine lyase/cysteine desulfurase
VRVVAVSATSLVPGLRVDLDRLGEACRAAGVRLVVDGAQSVGIMHWDLSRTPVDALAVGAQKGLCAEYGLGFLYVRREFADQLRPRYLARFGVDVGAADEADYEPGPLRYKPGALRFDLGNYDFLAAALVQDSLALLSRVGTRAIERRVVGLAQALCMSLQAVGMRCVPAPPGALANIVCLDPGPDPAVGHALHQHLRRDGVHVALRRRLLRFSFHLYNDASDVETAALSCRRWREGAR